MGIPPRKTSTARTSTQENNIQYIKITRKKQLFLLFWVAEKDVGKDFFKESAQTRLINIKTFKNFDETIHKVHCPPLHGFTEIQKIIDYWVNHYGGKDQVEVKEVSFFSHAGLDGPIIYSAINNTPVEMLEPQYKSQLIMEYWQKINFYWAKDSRLNFLVVILHIIRTKINVLFVKFLSLIMLKISLFQDSLLLLFLHFTQIKDFQV